MSHPVAATEITNLDVLFCIQGPTNTRKPCLDGHHTDFPEGRGRGIFDNARRAPAQADPENCIAISRLKVSAGRSGDWSALLAPRLPLSKSILLLRHPLLNAPERKFER